MENSSAYAIRAVDRVCDLLDALRLASEPLTLTTVAERVGLPKSSALRYLATLETRRYVTRKGDVYELGPAFQQLDDDYLARLREATLPHLVRLRDHFGETINLGTLDGNDIVHIEVVESNQPVRLAASRGARSPLHSTAMGKLLASTLEPGRLSAALADPKTAFTPHTITDPKKLRRAIAQAGNDGFAFDDCENQPDGRCVARLLPGAAIPLAFSVSAPSSRLSSSEMTARAAEMLAHHDGLLAAVRGVSR